MNNAPLNDPKRKQFFKELASDEADYELIRA